MLSVFYDQNKKNKHFFKEKYFKEKFPFEYQELNKFCLSNELINLDFKLKLYHFIFNLNDIPKCKECNSSVNFKNFTDGYREFCSNKCVNKSLDIKERIRDKFIINYGVDNPRKVKDINEKIKNTNILKYGHECSLSSKLVQEKRKETNLKKYNSENVFQNDLIKEKIKNSNFKKYGVNYFVQTEEFKNKNKETHLKKYGVTNYTKLKVRKDEIKENNLKKLIQKIESDYVFIDHQEYETFTLLHKKCEKNFSIGRNLLNLRYSRNQDICTNCNNINDQQSCAEQEIIQFLESLNQSCEIKNKKIISPYEIDIFLPEKSIGVEYHGLYFHSSKFKDKNYHFNKWKKCNGIGIDLIQIFEDEWKYKKDIVKSIIKSKLNVFDDIFYARKCIVKEIKTNEYNDFLNKNHIQGKCPSKYKLGLFFQNRLVSVIGLSNKRLSTNNLNENTYEITRFCNLLGVKVTGGFSKLLNFAIKNFNIKNIITFSDLRYFNGEVYKKNKFIFSHITTPNYWYFDPKNLIRYHRFKFAKHKLVAMGFNPTLTEKTIMKESSYEKIWDCGNIKWVLEV